MSVSLESFPGGVAVDTAIFVVAEVVPFDGGAFFFLGLFAGTAEVTPASCLDAFVALVSFDEGAAFLSMLLLFCEDEGVSSCLASSFSAIV